MEGQERKQEVQSEGIEVEVEAESRLALDELGVRAQRPCCCQDVGMRESEELNTTSRFLV